jgi:hypothetical protein
MFAAGVRRLAPAVAPPNAASAGSIDVAAAGYRCQDGGGLHEASEVGGDPVGRRATRRPPAPRAHQREPVMQLGVEVMRADEAAAGQERGLQVVVRHSKAPFLLWLGGS